MTEFDPGSECMLATGLTHASQATIILGVAYGCRVVGNYNWHKG